MENNLIISIKVGDIVYCKKETKDKGFELNEKCYIYEIGRYMNYNKCLWFRVYNITDKHWIQFNEDDFETHFYSMKIQRKLKLKKLNESSL